MSRPSNCTNSKCIHALCEGHESLVCPFCMEVYQNKEKECLNQQHIEQEQNALALV